MNVVRHLKFMYDISKALKWCCKNEYYISSKYSLRFNIDTVYRAFCRCCQRENLKLYVFQSLSKHISVWANSRQDDKQLHGEKIISEMRQTTLI